MSVNLPQICVVCFANYCRSPVAEQLMQRKFKEQFKVISAGIRPFNKPQMDPRSREFLLRTIDNVEMHNPKRINSDIVEKSSLILALDPFILLNLNKQFSRYKDKIYLLNKHDPKNLIPDPYTMSEKEYYEIMARIEKIVNTFQY